MLHRFRDRFGTAGLAIAIVALVVALAGTAVAASGALTGPQKKEVSKIAKKEARKYANSNPGAPGANGKDGTNGTNGAPGSPGAPGADGKTVLNGVGAPSNSLGSAGDFYIDTVEDEIYGPKTTVWGAGTELKGEEGEEGSPWTDGGTLPPNATETGVWKTSPVASTVSVSLEHFHLALQFPIPLAAPITSAANIEFKSVGYIGTPGDNCPGTAASPAAKAGFLCVYAAASNGEEGEEWTNDGVFDPAGAVNKTGTAGAVLAIAALKGIGVSGTFAVTAP